MINPNALKALQERYPIGTRIVLIHMEDPYTKLTKGDRGTVTGIDDMGTLQMQWDAGSTLGLIPGEDRFEKEQPKGRAVFVRKAAGIADLKEAVRQGGKTEPYVIENQVELAPCDYEAFSNDLLSDYDFVQTNLPLMRKDKSGTYHCLLVKPKGGTGGILVESEGYSYPRYTAIYKENE